MFIEKNLRDQVAIWKILVANVEVGDMADVSETDRSLIDLILRKNTRDNVL